MKNPIKKHVRKKLKPREDTYTVCDVVKLADGYLRVILVRVCGPVFLNLPQLYTLSSKKITYSYTWLNKMFT